MKTAQDIIALLEAKYSKLEPLTIVQIGAADLFGNAPAKLSDGSFIRTRDPIIGRSCGLIRHKPKIERLEHENAWLVTPPGVAAPVKIRAQDLRGET